MSQIPYDIIEAMVQCFGRCFHYKDPMANFLLSAGVSRTLVDRDRALAKFVWARNLLTTLNESEQGGFIARKILTELCKLKNVPDPTVEDRDQALQALRGLKELAFRHDLVAREDQASTKARRTTLEEVGQAARERARKLESLSERFNNSFVSLDRQGAGYELEDLLVDLFALSEVEFKKSYRIETQQIDGFFNFEGFHYLVEAKWRKGQAPAAEIHAFKGKVDTKLESTRGLFVSVLGFRPEVVQEFSGRGSNIILMDGQDMAILLEGRLDLREALRIKIENAAQRGVVFFSLAMAGN